MTSAARRAMLGLASIVVAIAATGCAATAQMFASPADLQDYRSFRMAAHEGRRLYQAQRYLKRHPFGVWADEVRAAFRTEEPAWFEPAKTSRARAREYVVDLPEGPHVEIARKLLLLFEEQQDDIVAFALMNDVRHTTARLDYESNRRRRISDVVLAEVAALADAETWQATGDVWPATLTAALRGDAGSTWGGAGRNEREDELFFVIPTPDGPQASVANVGFRIAVDHGRVARGVLHGADLFVRWTEALLLRVLDATSGTDRRLAASTIADVLGGAFEAAMPAARCKAALRTGEVLARACDGRVLSVRMGAEQGTDDSIEVERATPDGARAAGMR